MTYISSRVLRKNAKVIPGEEQAVIKDIIVNIVCVFFFLAVCARLCDPVDCMCACVKQGLLNLETVCALVAEVLSTGHSPPLQVRAGVFAYAHAAGYRELMS